MRFGLCNTVSFVSEMFILNLFQLVLTVVHCSVFLNSSISSAKDMSVWSG